MFMLMYDQMLLSASAIAGLLMPHTSFQTFIYSVSCLILFEEAVERGIQPSLV